MADGNLTAKLKLDTTSFDNAISGVTGSLGKLASGIGSTFAGISASVGAAVTAAAAGIGALVKDSVQSFGEYEQLVGGAHKIFDQMDYNQIANDAANAWQTMNLSASQYLAIINDVGASFAATMGDQQGYEVAKQGMQAIADYASGTGKSVDVLNQKFAMITRSASSYQSIADQFSGILPATSKDFLKQAQAAGYLSQKYTELTKVPIAEYQQSVAAMLEQGVAELGLAGNTAEETMDTITGSIAGLKAAWQNLMTGLADSSQNIEPLIENVVKMAGAVMNNLLPVITTALQSIVGLIAQIAPLIAAELPGLIATLTPLLLESALKLVEIFTDNLPQLIVTISDAILEHLPEFVEIVVRLLDDLMTSILPLLFTFAAAFVVSLGNSIADNALQLSTSLFQLIVFIVQLLTDNLPQIITAGISIIAALAESFQSNSVMIVESIVNLLLVILTTIIENLPTLIMAGLQIIMGLAEGLVSNLHLITDALVQLIALIPQVIIEHLPEILEAALQIGLAIIEGILMAIPLLFVSIGRLLGIVDDAEQDVAQSSDKISQSTLTMASNVGTGIAGIEASLAGLSASMTASSEGMSSAMSSMSNSAQQTMVPIYDGMGNLIGQFAATQESAKQSTQSVSASAKSAQTTAETSTEQILRNNAKIEASMKHLDDLSASPEVDPSGVESGCQAIISAVNQAINSLNQLAGASASAGGGSFGGGRASGGPVSLGSSYLVGEQGPELFVPRSDGYIVNAERTAGIMSGDDSEAGYEEALKNFFQAYLEPFMMEITTNTKVTAEKPQVTNVKIGQRDIVNAYDTQKKADGYSFVR